MKRRELSRRLSELGWRFLRQGGNHELWTNGETFLAVPRHAEVVEFTAKRILRTAALNPGPRMG
ncbi:MAG: type II toxin-antitoxin system HicA family toxin [Pseudomonadota bacterium]